MDSFIGHVKDIGCKNSFKCIKSAEPEQCHVIFGAKKKVLFVGCNENIECSFKNLFGDLCFCSCRIRLELVSKYLARVENEGN